jgi:hypothetical protein
MEFNEDNHRKRYIPYNNSLLCEICIWYNSHAPLALESLAIEDNHRKRYILYNSSLLCKIYGIILTTGVPYRDGIRLVGAAE